jgi:hypothetical protein
MKWESLGFKENPFSTDPISQVTLPIYVGHKADIKTCDAVLGEKNVLVVIEGARGIGTTSFANYLRFSAQAKELYFTPKNEIRVEPNWNLETLLAVILSNIVREIELSLPSKIVKDKRFQETKDLSLRIAEAYRSFGISAFGFGVNYGKSSGIVSQPTIVPSSVLGHHLEDLSALIQSAGYKYGTIIQLNNLDVGTIHNEDHLKYLFNAMRDYLQTNGISWLLVGDVGLRPFIAQQVDRLDDIIGHEIEINALQKTEFMELVHKRINYYRVNPKAQFPIDEVVFSYLYDITKGRLRYIFGLLRRLFNALSVGDLTDRITLDIAKPMIVQLAQDRVKRNKLSHGEEQVLRAVVELGEVSVTKLAKKVNKATNYVSNVLAILAQYTLVTARQEGRTRYYAPELDATIAYGTF